METTRRDQLRRSVVGPRGQMPVWPLPQLPSFEPGLALWAEQHGYFRDAMSTSVKTLHMDYVEWCEEEGRDVPCTVVQFREWLAGQKFSISKYDLVHGLMLRADRTLR